MEKFLYSIYDSAFGYNDCFVCRSDEEAIRQFNLIVNDECSLPHKFYADYSLYRLGKYDIKSGKVKADYEFLCNAASVLAKDDLKGVKIDD